MHKGRRKRKAGAALALAAALYLAPVLSGCGAGGTSGTMEGEAPVRELTEEERAQAVLAQNGLALALLGETAKAGENTCVCPVSLAQVFGMIAEGAGGETKREIEEQVLGMDAGTYRSFAGSLASDDCMHLANAVWVNRDRGKIARGFKERAEKYYGAEAEAVSFDEKGVQKINAWAERETKGMIPRIVDRLDADTGAAELVNAVAFEAVWERPYLSEQVLEKPFYAPGGTVQARFLYSMEPGYGYLAFPDGAKGVVKAYVGGKYAFCGILPPAGTAVEDWVSELDAEGLSNAFSLDRYPDELEVFIPEFTFSQSHDLVPVCSALGVERALSAEAELSGIMESGEALSLSGIRQNTWICVDREGTKAAAVTAAAATAAAAPAERWHEEVRLDRPFVFLIIDRETKLVYFAGIVNRPDCDVPENGVSNG